jgi:hypothetical protein
VKELYENANPNIVVALVANKIDIETHEVSKDVCFTIFIRFLIEYLGSLEVQ